MGQSLGELLIRSGACAPEAVRDALENQVVFGGRLGTNLLELGLVTEADLAAALARQHGVPAVHGEVRLQPAVLRLLSPAQAGHWEILPFALAGRRLTVLTASPSALRVLDDVAFATGLQVDAVVAAEARIQALLRSAYGLPRVVRGVAEGTGAPAGQAAAGPGVGGPGVAGPRLLEADLMGQEEFEALYARTGAAAPAGEALASPEDVELELEEVEEEEADPWPLRFDEAVRLLHGVHDRGAIAGAILRYARSRFRRAVLLTVHRGEARGWAGAGEGLGPAQVQRLRLPLGSPGIVDTVVRTRAHFLGPIPRTEANALLLAGLGGAPANALLVPILARGRVVNVLYADGGEGRLVDGGGMGELLILATRIAQSYEALLSRVRVRDRGS